MKRIDVPVGLSGTAMVLILAILALLLPSLTTLQKGDFKFPVLVNKGRQTPGCLTPLYMMNAWYDIERLEKLEDTLDLNVEPKDKYFKEFNYEWYENPPKADYSDGGLIVIVDTAQEITMYKKPIWARGLFQRNFTKNVVLQDDTLVQYVKSYPIYIANTSINKTALLETQDGSVIMVVEAKNQRNKWQPIEYWSHSWCGNSYFKYRIPPGYFAFTRGIKCSGNARRLCRLKLTNDKETLYSNEFYMDITDTQFEKPNGTE